MKRCTSAAPHPVVWRTPSTSPAPIARRRAAVARNPSASAAPRPRRCRPGRVVVLGGRPRHAAEQAVRRPLDERAMADDGPHRARADGEIGEVRLDLVPIERPFEQGLERLLHQRTSVLPRHDERAADLSALDQAGGQRERVEKTEARVGDVQICADGGSPIRRCANDAVAGSSMSRLTAAWMNSSTCSGAMWDGPAPPSRPRRSPPRGAGPPAKPAARGCRSSVRAGRTAA
jgi:hypothetical protein